MRQNKDQRLQKRLIAEAVQGDVSTHNAKACENGMRGYDFVGGDRANDLIRELEDEERRDWLRSMFPWLR